MNDAIETALACLMTTIQKLPESPSRSALETQAAGLRQTLEMHATYEEFPKVKQASLTSSSVSIRSIYERAYRADPKATEMDLVDAGLRDVATDLGAFHLSEEYRRELAATKAKSQLELGGG